MSCILHIETSTAVCSVAVSEDGQNIFVKEDLKGPSHAVSLGVFVDEALSLIDSHAIPLDAVAVSCGPGSYTGLRIGVSMAKGICYGRNVPLIGIPTLEVLSVPVLLYHELPEDALLCPMIDARRMEVYAAIYDRALNVKREISADIVDENSYLEYLEQHPVYFFGNGAAKCREKITHPNAHFIDDLHPLAKMMFPLAEKAVAINDYKDVAYFAQKLGISPKRLTNLIRSISGQSAREWIVYYTILEIKSLLRESSLDIKSIAARVNFPDQTTLSRYFRHYTGVTPSQYRKNIYF